MSRNRLLTTVCIVLSFLGFQSHAFALPPEDELQVQIHAAVEKNCRTLGEKPFSVSELFSRIYCDYENRWCERKGFSIFETPGGQTVVVQFQEHWGALVIDHILSNSDAVICRTPLE